MLLQASSSYSLEQQQLTAAVAATAKRMWGLRPPADFDTWFAANVDRLVALVVSGQQRAVAGSDEYVADTLDELGTPVDADATPIPEALIGVASDGRDLDSLMYGSVITAKGQIAQGRSVSQAWEAGGRALLLRVQTQLADTSRIATSLSITARKGVGYTRMLHPPSCSRCAVLAGKFYRWNAGFNRHPGCDCIGIPCREDRAGDLRTDPRQYFDSLSETMQDKLFTRAGAAAIRDGADMSQVVNARRGMSTTQTNLRGWIPKGRLTTVDVYGRQVATTTEGITRRGVAYQAMSRAGYVQRQTDVRGRRYFQARAPRLMPEAIYKIAEDREDALRLLRLYGYLA